MSELMHFYLEFGLANVLVASTMHLLDHKLPIVILG
jgi:hypothetical protein